MSKNRTLRYLGLGVVAAMSVGTVMLTGTAAFAAPPAGTLGSLTIIPGTGTDNSPITVHTSAGCHADSSAYTVVVNGPGAWSAGFVATGTSEANFSTSGGFDASFGNTMKQIGLNNNGTPITAGEYDVTLNCIDGFTAEVKGTFTGAMYFSSPTAYTTTDPSAPTTTTLAVSPTGPVNAGTPVTLTATVSPAVAGTVQFKDGANDLGAPVALSGGQATMSTSALSAGSHSLTAVYSGAAQGSTSQPVTLQVNPTPATQTSTALSVTPSGSVAQYTPVTLNATVTPAAAVGAIQFTDGGANLGSPVAVSNGEASLTTSSLAVGAHSITARFVPTDPATYVPSESAVVPVTITPFAGVSAGEKIVTTVQAGALVISVQDQSDVVLPSPTLTADASMLTTAGAIHQVTVTDTRAGNPGWNVSGQVTDFSDGASHMINGANLGWTPRVDGKAAAQQITPGAAVNPAAAIAPGAVPPAGSGLATGRTLATAAAGGSNGTAYLGADLALNVPTSTQAGTYSATLTLTAI